MRAAVRCVKPELRQGPPCLPIQRQILHQTDTRAFQAATPLPPLPDEERPAKPAMLRGWRGKCPSCGAGPMMRSFLKVRDACPVCGEELHHHRADDMPPYITITLVGHLIVTGVLALQKAASLPPTIRP